MQCVEPKPYYENLCQPKSLQDIKFKPYYENMCQPKSLLGINLRLQVQRSIPEARAFGPRFRTQALLGELDGTRLFAHAPNDDAPERPGRGSPPRSASQRAPRRLAPPRAAPRRLAQPLPKFQSLGFQSSKLWNFLISKL